ncbi:MAG: DNA ligase [Firmicutes bacterium]|nr:DNA ligase [Bacillota bacterium]
MKQGLTPIIPFEPVLVEKIPRGEQWAAQVKWDGVRMLTYHDGENTRLFNRRLNERTLQYPELADIKDYCRASSVVLDGEVIALVDGRPSFSQVMKRDGARLPANIERARRNIPVTHMLFDVLFLNGEWMTHLPLHQRQSVLSDIIIPREHVRLVENFYNGEGLYRAVSERGMEGIVCKDLHSSYAIEGKDRRWQKIKNYRDLIAVVGGVTYRAGVVNSVLLGLYDREGDLRYIGHAGAGRLTMSDWRSLTALVRPLQLDRLPFVNTPGQVRGAVGVKPRLTARVQFAEWTADRQLRQPSIQAFVDLPSDRYVFE